MDKLNEFFTSEIFIYVFIITFLLSSIKKYSSGVQCTSKTKLTGKIAIVTGSNTGIGFETALDFARRDARVILACRDVAKAKLAVEKIINLTDNYKVSCERLDLASFESIREFCKLMNSTLNRLDLLINNAGVMASPYSKTKDGFEKQFGTNHLGPFLLTNLLIDLIKETHGSRIVNVSSLVHSNCDMNWNDLNAEKSYSPTFAYSQSKLANILFTRELSDRLRDTSVTVYSVHPGVVRTEITRMLDYGVFTIIPILKQIFYPLWFMISKSSAEGAQTTIHCAVSFRALQYSGCYFSDCNVKTPSVQARSKKSATKLWEISEKLVNL